MTKNNISCKLSAHTARRSVQAASLVIALFLGFGGAEVANAGPVATRAALQGLLGGPGTLEDFEAFSVSAGSATGVFCNTGDALTSASMCPGHGSGLINAGISITKTGGSVFSLNAAGYFGAPSKELLMNSPVDLVVDFVSSVNAFGLDLRTFSGYGVTASVDIYAADDITLLATVGGLALSSSGAAVFFGWESAGGIGRISLSEIGQAWSPILDNIEWGLTQQAVPEPGTLTLAGLALAALAGLRKRKA